MSTRAEAQLQFQRRTAVLPFEIGQGRPAGDYSLEAARQLTASIQTLLPQFRNQRPPVIEDIDPVESVVRTAEDLGIRLPTSDRVSQLRIAQQMGLSTFFQGEIWDYRVVNTGGGKRADVVMRVLLTDVASGLPINGTALTASSTVRSADVQDETLINEAISLGAQLAANQILQQTLPVGTVLNTTAREALINQGSRSGFQTGQEVIIFRGREQVAQGNVRTVDPDSATISISRQIKGVAPGDRVQVVFRVPEVRAFGASGEVVAARSTRRTDVGAVVAILLVLGLVVLLFSGGRGSSPAPGPAQGSVTASSFLSPYDGVSPGVTPANRISWSGDLFAKGNLNRVRWQVWRDDFAASPVVVVDGAQTFADDLTQGRPNPLIWSPFTQIDGVGCAVTSLPEAEQPGVPGPQIGRPNLYRVELVYRIFGFDAVPPFPEVEFCYFRSAQQSAQGTATALVPPTPQFPVNISVSGNQTFQFINTAPIPANVEYILQLSPDPTFRTEVATVGRQTNRLSFAVDVNAFFPAAQIVYWRVGSRNIADSPGPLAVGGERYVFSQPVSFSRPAPPPAAF
ncbi:MAG: hypothetical protein ACK4P3_08085 [Fimbriimonadaceae bacterium]